jgi:NodT family efflux transporter outer membrane factor (OMF) lipoprotein
VEQLFAVARNWLRRANWILSGSASVNFQDLSARRGTSSQSPGAGFRRFAALRLLACFGLIVGAQACRAIGPDYQPPQPPAASRWVEADDPRAQASAVDTTRWWTAFNDPTLDELIAEAREKNLTLQTAALRVLEAQALRAVAFGNLFPQQQKLGATFEKGQISKNRATTSGSGSSNARRFGTEAWTFSFDASWEIDLWGRVRRGLETADAQVLAQLANYDDVLVTLLGDVASTYVQIRVLEERLTLARDNVRVQREGMDVARVRYEAGGTSELDLQQARTLLADTEASIPQLEIQLRQAGHALSVLLGSSPTDVSRILDGGRGIPAAPAAVAAGIPADLLRRRPDVRRAERELAAQSGRIGVAKGDLLPRLQLVGSIGLAAESARHLFEGDSFEAFGGPRIDWPILNYGRIVNAVRVEDARFEELAAGYAQAVLRAQQEVEDALVGYLLGAEKVKRLAESVDAAKRSVELSLIQYREGAADYTRVLTTQQSKLREDEALATSRGAVTLDVISLYRAMGGGWELREGEELVPAATRERMRRRTYWGGMLETKSVTGATDREREKSRETEGGAPATNSEGGETGGVPAAASQ